MPRCRIWFVITILTLLLAVASGCGESHDFNHQIKDITNPYRFHLATWEIKTLAGEVGEFFWREKAADNATAEIITYFTNAAQIRNLEASINAIKAGNENGDIDQLQSKIEELQRQNAKRRKATEKALEKEVRQALSEQGINNPINRKSKVGFPPVKIYLGNPPHMLVISPRDRIESTKEIQLLPEMTQADMEKIEGEVESLGVSVLVVDLGGLSTYPSYVSDDYGLRFTIETIAHEWIHQYLFFTPLGFRYTLDQIGINQDYEIATINETVAGMVSQEIGGILYRKLIPQETSQSTLPQDTGPQFDFNKTMREIRLAVDSYLARGEIERAERYMKEKRQYLAENGYYIRKLNQAYFAFHGTYADSPTSVSPIGAKLRTLRDKSATLKEFIERVAGIKSLKDLEKKIE